MPRSTPKAFMRFSEKQGLNFVLDTYLPEKLKKGRFLP
jgi:hypothetical protein